MNSRLSYSPARRLRPATEPTIKPVIRRNSVAFCTVVGAACLLLFVGMVPRASANSDAPAWMHGIVNAALPDFT